MYIYMYILWYLEVQKHWSKAQVKQGKIKQQEHESKNNREAMKNMQQ